MFKRLENEYTHSEASQGSYNVGNIGDGRVWVMMRVVLPGESGVTTSSAL